MSTAFAAFETLLGAVTTSAFANATLVMPAGAQADGVFSQPYADGVGNLAMPGREVSFVARTAALTEPVTKGTAVTVINAGGTTAWRVIRRVDTPETGDTELPLERA